MKLKVVEFSPAQYLKLKQTLKELEYDERKIAGAGHGRQARRPVKTAGVEPPAAPAGGIRRENFGQPEGT